MAPLKNLPLLLNCAYSLYNRGLVDPRKDPQGLAPIINKAGEVIETYCNRAMIYVLNAFGYPDLNGMRANEMIDHMNDHTKGWINLDDQNAQQRANEGVIVIAGYKAQPHGHVCLIIPGILEKSPSFGKAVPKCINIGKDVFIGKRVSAAFRPAEMPKYWALASMI